MSVSAPLPAPNGSAAFACATAAEEGLKTAVLTERLSGTASGPTFVSTYRFQAPDRVEIATNDSIQVIVGQEAYRKTGSGPWEKSPFPAPGFGWPSGFYREFWQGAAAIRVVGTETLDGTQTDVVSFVRPDVPAWFRIWLRRPDRVVVRQEMRAEGHIMDHAYTDLNGPVSVVAPP